MTQKSAGHILCKYMNTVSIWLTPSGVIWQMVQKGGGGGYREIVIDKDVELKVQDIERQFVWWTDSCRRHFKTGRKSIG